MPRRKHARPSRKPKAPSKAVAKYVKRTVRKAINGHQESKFILLAPYSPVMNAPPIQVSNPTTGTAVNQRVGAQISISSFRLHFELTRNVGATQAGDLVRFIVFQWTDESFVLAISDILENPLMLNSLYRTDALREKQIHVLYDKTYALSASYPVKSVKVNLTRGFRRKISYGSSSPTTVVGLNNLYYMFLSQNSTFPPTCQAMEKFSFKDA